MIIDDEEIELQRKWLEKIKQEKLAKRPTCKHESGRYWYAGGFAHNIFTGEKTIWPAEEPECSECGLPESEWKR